MDCTVSPLLGLRAAAIPARVLHELPRHLTHLAKRILIFIQVDCADIGLMCCIGVGIVEVSSCEATTVVEG